MDAVYLWPLTARAAELDVFTTVWSTARCRSVVVCGPPGIGKTRLADEYYGRAARAGAVLGRATASRAAAAVPLGAIAHLIPAGVDLADPVRGFAQVASALARPGRGQVVLVDDLQWLDAASAVLLRQLIDAGSVRLIGTVRSGEPIGEAVEALCSGDTVCRVDLAAFDLHQVEEVLSAALGGSVSRQTVRRLHDSSGGNALYLRELVAGALKHGTLADDGEIWELAEGRTSGTPRLAELISARLESAGPAGRPVLELLALCEPVPLADAEAVAPMDVLVELEAAGLIRTRTDQRTTSVSLAHPLYAEALRAGLTPLRRRRLLLDQVDRVKSGADPNAVDTRRIAAWQLEATGTAEPALLIEAAALARHAHDYPQAKRLLEALSEDDFTTSARLLFGDVLWHTGEPARADEVLTAAGRTAEGERQFLSVVMAHALNRSWGEGDYDGTLDLLESAQKSASEPEVLTALRLFQGAVRINAGDTARGLTLLEDLAEELSPTAEGAAWLHAATMKPVGLSYAGRTAQAVAWADRAYRLRLSMDERVLFPHPSFHLISAVVAHSAAGGFTEARGIGQDAIYRLTQARASGIRMWMSVYVGYLELMAGHLSDARRLFAEAAAVARALRRVVAVSTAQTGLALCAALLGDLDAAEQARTEADKYPVLGMHAHWNALAGVWIRVANGESAREIQATLIAAADQARASGCLLGEALLLADLARLGGAAQSAARLSEIADVFDGDLVPALAHLAAALADDSPAQLVAAAAELASRGADLMAAEASCAASAAYARAGDTRRATAAAQDANRHLERCGDRPRTPLLRDSQTTASLTDREREIAVMAARGTPSREIAESLHVSVRTVQNHLQRAYTKLGVTSRSDLRRVLGA
ncbi:AAA family ATPase [Actinospica sp. MGRD01-02]|uniref:AAA family ATPase n=1 Tax=Actinospica acidithermotolerans TaxID=2828514 RepID=A0A941IIP7_9ACTN|nr:LuxR family transcriptional regulator [Actinospica acidithermotolerans]MBR7827022.1 AAA family ATPase [Actinospica acidithermotolerans]